MKDMGAVGGGMTAFYAQMPDEVTLNSKWESPDLSNTVKEK
jgi:molecular chaperone HtpG